MPRQQQQQQRTCRYCFECGGEDLVSEICHCRGSLGWVHTSCMRKYLVTSGKRCCPECRFEFAFEKRPATLADLVEAVNVVLCEVVELCVWCATVLVELFQGRSL